MTRADAWLLDPFGAGLGRWGGAPSSGAPAAWWQPILDILDTAGGGYLWLHEVGIDTAVEQPVALWEDVTGAQAFVQPGVSSIRPTRKAGALRFDGIDDRMNEDTELASWLARSAGPWTVGVGSPQVTPLSSDVWWGAALTGAGSNLLQLSSNNQFGRVGGPAILTGADPRPGPVSAWVAVGGGDALRRVSATETAAAYGTQLTGINTFTLGGMRSGSPRNILLGDISWVIVSPAALSSANMLAIETVLAANGYPT